MSVAFCEGHENLGLKGVQLESMGYLHFKHALEWGMHSLTQKYSPKYSKYRTLNEHDLKKLKITSFKEFNYEQIENFVEYEQFLAASYFEKLYSMYLKQVEVIKNAASNHDYVQEVFGDASE